jgi:outer membrane protein
MTADGPTGRKESLWRLCVALVVGGLIGVAEPAFAQAPATVLQLSPEGAVALALENNLSLDSARLGVEVADLDVNAARTAWTPELSTRFVSTDSAAPTSSAFDDAGLLVLDRQVASDVAVAQQLPWGTSYRIGWTGGRRSNTSALARFRPELSAGAGVTLIQPLLKGLTFDAARASRDVSRRNRDVAAAELDAAVASTRHAVLSAYWSWVHARELLGVQRQSLSLAETLLEGNRRRIAVGAMASVDAIEAEAEVARRTEAIIIGEKDVANAEDILRMLMFEPGSPRQRDLLEPDRRPGSVQRSFGSVLEDLARRRYPTWSVEVGVTYPLGTSTAKANTARAMVAQQQRETLLAMAEQQVETEVTAALREVTANEKRLVSTANAVAFSERRLDAEQRKFSVGLSTSFFVFQAQRDLASTREALLRSALDYQLSVVDLEAVQTVPIRSAGDRR